MNNPENQSLFISITSMFVYKQVFKEVITKIDGKITDTQKTTEWIDFTREWIKKLQKNDNMIKDF